MSIPGWQRLRSPKSGRDRTDPLATARGGEGDGAGPLDHESVKARVVARIWREFSKQDFSSPKGAEANAGSNRHRREDHARAVRLLVHEITRDTEVSAALRTDLAESLRSVAKANAERLFTDSPIEPGLQSLGVSYRPPASYRGFSYARRAEPVARRLQATHGGLAQRLEEAEYLVHEIRMSHLKAAVAVSLTRDIGRPVGRGAIVRNLVQAADSLGEVADVLRSVSEGSGSRLDDTSTFEVMFIHHGRLERAAREVARSAAALRDDLRTFVEGQLPDNDEAAGGAHTYYGGLLDLKSRLQRSSFDPGIGCAFRSVGDQLTCSMFSVWEPSDDREAFARGVKAATST